MQRRRSITLVCALLAVASASHAALLVDVSADASASFQPACGQIASGATGQSVGCLISVFARTASSQASANPGVLRVEAFAGADAPDVNLGAAFAFSRASASFTDSLTFFGAANTQVTITAQVAVQGSVSADTYGSPSSGLADADWVASGTIFGANFSGSGSFDDSGAGPNIVNANPNQMTSLVFVLTFDSTGRSQTGALLMSATVAAFANALGSSDPVTGQFLPGHSMAHANFSSTVYWAGVTSVVDAQGNPVSGVSVLSDSGFDYMQSALPLTEPASGALLLGALAAWAARRRRSAASRA